MPATSAAPRPWIAYPPARSRHSPLARYQSIRASSSALNWTPVCAAALRTFPSSIRHTPLMTAWRRPARAVRVALASSASCGFPYNRAPSETTVSTPSTSPPPSTAIADALRNAFSSATSCGGPASSSSTSAAWTEKSTPSCSRIARRCGERDASTSRLMRSKIGEEQRHFSRRGVGRIGAVDHVLAHVDGIVATDRARRRLERIGGGDHLTCGNHGLLALEHHRHQRRGCDERHKLLVEALALMLGVMLRRHLAAHRHEVHRHQPQALALESRDDLAG